MTPEYRPREQQYLAATYKKRKRKKKVLLYKKGECGTAAKWVNLNTNPHYLEYCWRQGIWPSRREECYLWGDLLPHNRPWKAEFYDGIAEAEKMGMLLKFLIAQD